MPGFVIDASATLPWRFEDEATPWTEALLNRVQNGEEIWVPAHWPLEITNALIVACRRGRITNSQVREFLDDLAAFPLHIESHRLTAYDAAYLELVKRTGLPLATLDVDLRKAAEAQGALLVGEA